MTYVSRADRWFVRRHNLDEIFWFMTDASEPDKCWPWLGHVTTQGYGRVIKNGVLHWAHRLSLELHHVEIPDGFVVDHLCHTRDTSCIEGNSCRHRRCVNPQHLDVVTDAENILRGRGFAPANVAKTHCPANHPLSGDNLADSKTGYRICKACKRERAKDTNAQVSAAYHARRAQGYPWQEARRLALTDVRIGA